MIVLQKDLILKNRYKLVKSLGQGGLSSVWLAEDIKLEILVALKFLNESLINDINHIKNFRNEWKIAHNLIHPNIIKVYEYHADTTIPFYAMQYIDGYEISILSGEISTKISAISLIDVQIFGPNCICPFPQPLSLLGSGHSNAR